MEKALSAEDKEVAYHMGYDAYNKREYAKAKEVFTTLVFSDPYVSAYWKGLASTLQMKDEFAEAAQAWALLALLNERDPLPHFHAAECLLASGEKGEAKKAVQCAKERVTSSEIREKINKLIKVCDGK